MAGGELLKAQNKDTASGERQVGLLLQQSKLRDNPFPDVKGGLGPTGNGASDGAGRVKMNTVATEFPSVPHEKESHKAGKARSNSQSRAGTNTASGTLPSFPTFPVREGEPDCQYYLKTGKCSFGVACKFNHPPGHAGSKRSQTRSGPLHSVTQSLTSGDLPSLNDSVIESANGGIQVTQSGTVAGVVGNGVGNGGHSQHITGARADRTQSSSSDIILVNIPSQGQNERQLELAELQRLTDRLSNELAQLRAHRAAVLPEGVVQINVGGRMYQVRESTVKRLPHSKLAELKAGPSEVHFFDRNPNYFEVILDFHRDGVPFIPSGLDPLKVRSEAVFWNVLADMFGSDTGEAAAHYRFHRVFPHQLNSKAPAVSFQVRDNEQLEICGISGQGKLTMSSVALTQCGGQLAVTDVVIYDSEVALAPGAVKGCRCQSDPNTDGGATTPSPLQQYRAHQTGERRWCSPRFAPHHTYTFTFHMPECVQTGGQQAPGLSVEFRTIYSFTGEDTFHG